MAQRTFTLQEAQVLLPVLRLLLKQAIDGKKLIETIDAEFQALGQRIFLSGGLLVEIGKAATRRAERDKTVQRIKDVVAEIDATGVQVKDLDMGLLDFPCVVDGNTILLCWKMGEDKITHWHGVDEGYAGRKPIDENIEKSNCLDTTSIDRFLNSDNTICAPLAAQISKNFGCVISLRDLNRTLCVRNTRGEQAGRHSLRDRASGISSRPGRACVYQSGNSPQRGPRSGARAW